MPWFNSNILTNTALKVASHLDVNPRLGWASVGAGLIMPWFVKNDDRGYFKSGLVTTPLITAAYLAAPSVFNASRKETERLKNYFHSPGRKPGGFKVNDAAGMRMLQEEMNRGNIKSQYYYSNTRDFFAVEKPSHFQTTSEHLRNHLDKLFSPSDLTEAIAEEHDLELARRYVSTVLHGEKLRTSNTADLAAYMKQLGVNETRPELLRGTKLRGYMSKLHVAQVAPDLTIPEILTAVEGEISKGNEPLVKGMLAHIRKFKTSEYQANTVFLPTGANEAINEIYTGIKKKEHTWDWSPYMDQFRREFPEESRIIDAHIKDRFLKPDNIHIIKRADSEQLLGLQIGDSLRDGAIRVPLVQKDGTVFGGKSWQTKGIARMGYTEDRLENISTFMLHNLKLGKAKLKDEMNRSIIWNGVDPIDTFVEADATGTRNISPIQQSVMWRQAAPRRHVGFDGNGFDTVSAESREAFVGGDKMDKLGVLKTGSENSMSKGIVDLAEMRNLAPFGMPDPAKQNPWQTIMARDVHFVGDIASHRPSYMPEGVLALEHEAGELAPIVGAIQVGLPNEQISFFSSLPSKVSKLKGFRKKAIKNLTEMYGLTPEAAEEGWDTFSTWLTKGNNLEVVRKARYLQDTSKLMRKDFHDLKAVRTRNFRVKVGELPDIADGSYTFSKDKVIGFNDGLPVTAEGPEGNRLVGISNDQMSGEIVYTVEEQLGVDSGLKLHAPQTGRGHAMALEGPDFDRFIKGTSRFNTTFNVGPTLNPKAVVLSSLHADMRKGNPIDILGSDMAQTLKMLNDSGETELARNYISSLEKTGDWLWSGGTNQLINLSQNNSGVLKDAVARLEQTEVISKDLMEAASKRLRRLSVAYPKALSKEAKAFASWNGSFTEFYERAGREVAIGATNHAKIAKPKNIPITRELSENLLISGQPATLRELVARAEVEGKSTESVNMMKYLSGDSEAITQKVSLLDALGGRSPKSVGLVSAKSRVDTIFSDTHPLAKSNFLIEMPDGNLIPVLSNQAHSAKLNKHGGVYSGNLHERPLLKYLKAHQARKPEEELNKLYADYENALKEATYGKESSFQAYARDPEGIAGIYFPDSSLKPNEIRIGQDAAGKIGDKAARKALFEGKAIPATMFGYPIADVPKVMMKVDHNLTGTGMIGVSNEVAIRGYRDFDGDPGYVNPIFDEEASQEIRQFIASSENAKELGYTSRVHPEKFAEIIKNGKGKEAKDLFGKLEDYKTDFLNTHGIYVQRTAGETIGELSNTHSLMRTALLHNTGGLERHESQFLNRLFFEIYQTPISAAKHSGETVRKSVLRNINRNLASSLKETAGFERFHQSITDLFSLGPKHLQDILKEDDVVDMLKRMHGGITNEARQISAATISSSNYVARNIDLATEEGKATMRSAANAAERVNYTGRGIGTVGKAAKVESTFAHASAEALGSINEGIKSGESVFRSAMEAPGVRKALMLGAGIATLAGLVTTSVAPRARSLNQYRPEVTGAGADAIPGEPVAGSYSSNPPRTQVDQSSGNVKRVIAAPMYQGSNVEVNVTSNDPSRATEVSKITAQLAKSGTTTVTNNYKGSKSKSLRDKQKLKDALDES